MNQPMGLQEFFAMEAGEYLEQLDGLVSAPAGPDREELLRAARSLRGSALMANQQPIGDAAAALESLARALREEKVSWSVSTKELVVRAVDDLKVLVRSVGKWTDAETAKAANLTAELKSIAGVPAPIRRSGPTRRDIDAGTRAFLAREAATVSSSLDQLARAFQQGIPPTDRFDRVYRAMQPLRGLAALPELSPMPEFLDGVERAIAAAERGTEHPNDFALLFDSAARGLSRAAREITTSGSAQADSPEAKEFARRLGAILDVGGDVVPIESLYFEDAGPHVVEKGTPSAAPGRLVQLELVAHGEHLKQAASELDRAQWDTQRELRALALTATFRTLVAATGGPLEEAVARFAASAASAVSSRAPVHHTDVFVAQLRKAGEILSASAEGDRDELAQELATVTATLRQIPTAPVAERPVPAGGPLARPPAPSAAIPIQVVQPASVEEIEIPEPAVPEPVEQVVPPVVRPPITEAVAPAPRPKPEPASMTTLAAGWARYEELRAEPTDAVLSIEELLAGIPAAAAVEAEPRVAEPPPVVARPEALAAEPEPATAAAEEEIVPIEDLCYTGAGALERARKVRSAIRGALAADDLDRPALRDLVEELLDLVELGKG